MKIFHFFLILACLLTTVPVFAAGEINILDVKVLEKPPFQYKVQGTVVNETDHAREVVLRAEVVMYDETAPKGDLPVRVLRKDMTVILKAAEKRNVELTLIQEGRMPDVRFRVEPILRMRRQRLWIFPYENLNAKEKKTKNKKK